MCLDKDIVIKCFQHWKQNIYLARKNIHRFAHRLLDEKRLMLGEVLFRSKYKYLRECWNQVACMLSL